MVESETVQIINSEELIRALGRKILVRIPPYSPQRCIFEGAVDGDSQVGFLIKGNGVGIHERVSYRDKISNLTFKDGVTCLSPARKLATYHPKINQKLYDEKTQQLMEANLL